MSRRQRQMCIRDSNSGMQNTIKRILLKDFVKFIRATSNKPELLILETFIKKGHIILDINLKLDQNGKIKNDYKIRGLLKDGKLKFFNGSRNVQLALTFGLILGHVVYLVWKYIFLILIGAN